MKGSSALPTSFSGELLLLLLELRLRRRDNSGSLGFGGDRPPSKSISKLSLALARSALLLSVGKTEAFSCTGVVALGGVADFVSTTAGFGFGASSSAFGLSYVALLEEDGAANNSARRSFCCFAGQLQQVILVAKALVASPH